MSDEGKMLNELCVCVCVCVESMQVRGQCVPAEIGSSMSGDFGKGDKNAEKVYETERAGEKGRRSRERRKR